MGLSSSNDISEENETKKTVQFAHTQVRQPHSYTTHRSVVHADDDQLKTFRKKKAQQGIVPLRSLHSSQLYMAIHVFIKSFSI